MSSSFGLRWMIIADDPDSGGLEGEGDGRVGVVGGGGSQDQVSSHRYHRDAPALPGSGRRIGSLTGNVSQPWIVLT